MTKKIIFLAVCAVLLLIFASTGYGGPDPRYKLREHPWNEMDECSVQDSTVVTYDKTPTDNNRLDFMIIRILGTHIILITSENSFSSSKNPIHKPTIFKEK